ncbi:hypothetical protein L226DRAFT_198512 [Lentinus tigrinus ALCF2SS1-7]|uniref:Uncharacterized protein n=1 Tax=Lentinus tigrinus ALCF2SS1-6 TaxID=1328759 RepID=A0A5C2SRA1_9APHY|nr:hypothetical protein L227DRAFT_144286 [Lentinus tigrinus ALCF2SS1-6]RPD80347.1 hypothetical protein L226DRAFT_198512 [Lentinus tigrinus ALCF2SS1-7]
MQRSWPSVRKPAQKQRRHSRSSFVRERSYSWVLTFRMTTSVTERRQREVDCAPGSACGARRHWQSRGRRSSGRPCHIDGISALYFHVLRPAPVRCCLPFFVSGRSLCARSAFLPRWTLIPRIGKAYQHRV